MKHLAKLNWIITLLWILGCAGRSETLGPEKPAENKGPGNMATTVTVFLAEYKPFEYHIMTEGKILSERQVEVVSKTSGLVLSVKKQNSSRINQGKVLVFLDSAKQALELERARTNYREKLTEYQSLLMGYTLPGEALKENLRYSSGLAGAEITLKGARMDMANTRITSPINGRVANLDVQRGQTINAGEKLCLVYDPTRMIVVCAVPEYDA
ncbi:MAG: efflux RND transporter periplasmic adaptor subunit, partial [Cyclobacteriaceae bacterium]|nr:efflux RND transporter periplasmic adaptor subunit [Cyclobacteriaceae bacterium]